MKRVGVDIGGTFTDLVVHDEVTGELTKTKAPTTPHAPEEGLLRACSQINLDMTDVSLFMHGTTLVTNLILTRTGAKVGLITTKGFRDILEIGRSYRKEVYNLQWDKPKPFVPRHLVYEVTERMDSSGTVLVPIDREEVASVVQQLLAKGVEAIAVRLFNSYANAEHERVIGQIILEMAPNLHVCLACEVDPRIREYQATSTAVLSAYSMPRTHGYIERLDKALGISVNYMHSGAGIIPSSEVKKFPIALVASGPAAGVLASRFIGQKINMNNLITADVGGTSFDVCVIRDGRPDVNDEVEVEWGIPARTQSIDINSIGAGGGSIAWIDEGGALAVGPQSAGADPGPACYDLGGIQPTVTDSYLILGLLDPDNFLGGNLKVNPQKSYDAIIPIAEHFNVSVEEAAAGIYRIANASMAQAIQEATVKKGIDPREFALVAFGGAGGMHAVAIAQEVGIPTVIVPPFPSTFSAFGLLTADLKNTFSQTVMISLDSFTPGRLKRAFRESEKKARTFLTGQESLITDIQVEHVLDVRYVGQSNEVAVLLTDKVTLKKDAIYREFERVHHSLYGTRLGDSAEIVNVRVTVTGVVPQLALPSRDGSSSSKKAKPKGHRKVALYEEEIAIFDRDELSPGMIIRQPCIIEEVDSTFFMSKGCVAQIDGLSNIHVKLPKQKWNARPTDSNDS